MTVIKSKRHESEMEFIHTARELRLYTTRKCAGFPKRYTFMVSNPLADSARRIHQYCKMANSIYLLNVHEAQIRRPRLARKSWKLHDMALRHFCSETKEHYFNIARYGIFDCDPLLGQRVYEGISDR